MGAELVGDERFELASREACIADDDLAGLDEVAVVAEHRLGGLAFADLGFASPQTTGMPSGVQAR